MNVERGEYVKHTMNNNAELLKNVAVVLCRPKLSENIGAVARAAVNMGLGSLILVEPNHPDEAVMKAMATRQAHEMIDNISIYDDLKTALADFQLVIGTTARLGSHRGPFFSPHDAAERLFDHDASDRTALIFGPERSGLTTPELRLCQMVVRIPTSDPEHSSLNLAQAVLILGYEILLAAGSRRPAPRIKPAPNEELQAMYDHLSDTMLKIGFLPDQNTDHWLMSFKHIFNRSGLTHGECNLIRGMCRQINWAVNNARLKGS